MKQKFAFIILTFFALQSFAQSGSKIFDEVKNITVRNVGVIKKNNEVKGYFSFYEYDKASKGTLLFKLNLMDENLNQLGTKEIEGPKSWELISSGFDGNNFCFKFYDPKAKLFQLKVYDQQAKEVTMADIDKNYGDNSTKYKMYQQYENPELGIIPDNGFVNYTFNDENDGFTTTYINGSPKRQWSRAYEPDGKYKIMIPAFLGGNNEMVLSFVTKVNKGMYTSSTDNTILAHSTGSGSKVFEISTNIDEKFVSPINAVFETDKITLVGLFYPNSSTSTSSPDGLAFIEIDKKGKILKKSFQTFEQSLGKYFTMDSKGKLDGDYFFYVHDIERTKNNTNVLVGEKFRKKTSAGGAILAMASRGGSGFVKLELENMILIEYDMNGKVLQAKEIPKAKGFTGTFPSYSGFFPPYLLANVADIWGWMDYMYTLKNEDNSELTFSFLDYEKLEDDDKKTHNFGQIKYKNGVITSDKVAIKNEKATLTRIYPAKAGYILQMNYFKKKKQMTMDFIKLN
jgi:uncharacterized protein YuzE